MKPERIINLLYLFNQHRPEATIETIEINDDDLYSPDGKRVTVWWYTDNDGGHDNFYV